METPKAIKRLPHEPGVYIFKNTQGSILYVGKAKDLNRRVSQYFGRDETQSAKTALLVSQIAGVASIKTHSEFDALILEAKLIRLHMPKYNIIAKDDRSPLYVCITFDEELPRVLCVRKTSITPKPRRVYFGPFQSGRAVRMILHKLRHIAPFCTQKIRDGRPCFYTHLALCHPCPSVLSHMDHSRERQKLVREYRNNTRRIADILSGKSLSVLHTLEKDMRTFAHEEKFEQAQKFKHYTQAIAQLLQEHYDPSLYTQDESFLENVYQLEMSELAGTLLPFFPMLKTIIRIECIDISNTVGRLATGSLVVLINGRPAHADYRRFRIGKKQAPNDVAMIAEVLQRRLRHTEWEYPQLFVIDGGKGQVASARKVLAAQGLTIPLVGLAKRFEEIIIAHDNTFITLRLPIGNKGLQPLMRIRDESHRFALSYHRLLRAKSFLKR